MMGEGVTQHLPVSGAAHFVADDARDAQTGFEGRITHRHGGCGPGHAPCAYDEHHGQVEQQGQFSGRTCACGGAGTVMQAHDTLDDGDVGDGVPVRRWGIREGGHATCRGGMSGYHDGAAFMTQKRRGVAGWMAQCSPYVFPRRVGCRGRVAV